MPPHLIQPISLRVLSRLRAAKKLEPDPWVCDDLDVAYLTVLYAATDEAVECSPHVLASYEVLGLHPEKVWPAILARRKALGPISEEVWGDPARPVPKKPVQSASLWPEKTNAARATNLCGGETLLRDNTTVQPMAAPSIAAGYPNPDERSSGKKGEYSLDEQIAIVARSGADESIRNLTLAALAIRGEWPHKKGPASNIISVSVRSLYDKMGVWRSTAQRRIQRAKRGQYWREVRGMNSWLNCPQCGAERTEAQCPKCPHKGNGNNPKEFRATFTYAIDIGKFETAQPCRQVRELRELKQRKGPVPVPDPQPDPPMKAEPVKQPAANSGETRRPLQITHDVKLTIAQHYAKARKEGKSEVDAIRATSEALSSDARYLAESEVRLQLKIWQTAHGSLEPRNSATRAPVKCLTCEDTREVWNKGPGPRRIPCPDCKPPS